MNELEELYNDVIMDHYTLSPNKKDLLDCTCQMKGINPSCGDEITIKLKIENDIIMDMAFLGTGCAISISSTSIMIDLIKYKTIKEAFEIIKNFKNMINKEDSNIDSLEEAGIFQNISNMPARIKCATLCYNTLEKLLIENNIK